MSVAITKAGVRSEINVTPLVDVCLVLLIIFMVITPLLRHESTLQLPQTGSAGSGEKSRQLRVSMQLDGMIRVDDTLVALSDLTGQLRRVRAADPDRPVIIEGDRRLPYEQISKMIESIEDAGFQKYGLITVRRSGLPPAS
jgi:biopolymer transport protein TolR